MYLCLTESFKIRNVCSGLHFTMSDNRGILGLDCHLAGQVGPYRGLFTCHHLSTLWDAQSVTLQMKCSCEGMNKIVLNKLFW